MTRFRAQKLLLFVGLTVLMQGLVGCGYGYSLHHSRPGSDANAADFSLPASQISFKMVMDGVLKSECLNCHAAATGNRGGINLETFANVSRHATSIGSDVRRGTMPKDHPLTSQQRDFILRWLDAGGPEFGGPPSGQGPGAPKPVPTTPPTTGTGGTSLDYSTVKSQVFDQACLGCHSAEKHKGGIVLETYAQVFKNARDIKSDVLDGSMPKAPAAKLTVKQKALILEWLSAGAPEHAGVAGPGLPSDSPVSAGPPTGATTEDVILQRGRYLTGLSGCANCHTRDPGKPFAGGKAVESSFGTFYAPNISPDKETGIGAWSESDFLKALRHGLNRRNEFYYPAFPYSFYSKMSDFDLLSIRAYLLSLAPIRQVNTPHKIGFPFNQRPILFAWRVLNFPFVKNQDAYNFRNARGPFQVITEKDLTWNQGAYLVEGPLHCAICHTQRDNLGGLRLDVWMGGTGHGEGAAPNITPDTTGLRNWSRTDWLDFLNTGHRPTGGHVTGDMRQVIEGGTSQMSRADQLAVIEYLRAVPAVSH